MHFNKDLSIDPGPASVGLTRFFVPLVLIGCAGVQANTLKEFTALAKANPVKLNSPRLDWPVDYIAGELLKQTRRSTSCTFLIAGTPEQLTSLMRGDAQLSMAFLGTLSASSRPVRFAPSRLRRRSAAPHCRIFFVRPSPRPGCPTTKRFMVRPDGASQDPGAI